MSFWKSNQSMVVSAPSAIILWKIFIFNLRLAPRMQTQSVLLAKEIDNSSIDEKIQRRVSPWKPPLMRNLALPYARRGRNMGKAISAHRTLLRWSTFLREYFFIYKHYYYFCHFCQITTVTKWQRDIFFNSVKVSIDSKMWVCDWGIGGKHGHTRGSRR